MRIRRDSETCLRHLRIATREEEPPFLREDSGDAYRSFRRQIEPT